MTPAALTGLPLPLTALFAGLCALLFTVFCTLVIVNRGRTGTSLGDGGDEALRLAIRRFGNFTEFVPIGLVLMAVIELNGAAEWMLWAMGGLLVAGRLLHFCGLDPNKGATAGRVAGIAANLIAILGGGVVAIVQFLDAA
ncbi:MAG: MAPEG family protein [Proteobacteria bacterium]|nr:MAPEG family protein [Pseudomonadota bacterium]